MPSDDAEAGLVPGPHPDRDRWNARYAGGFVPSFAPHPLAVRALSMDLPDGPVADLACGASGTALLAAAHGRRVTAVDVADVALGMLGDEAKRRGLDRLITLVHADLAEWRPGPASYALVIGTGFWDAAVFATAARCGGTRRAAGLAGLYRRGPAGAPQPAAAVVPGGWRARLAPPGGLHPRSTPATSDLTRQMLAMRTSQA